jgi:hypothetical protein
LLHYRRNQVGKPSTEIFVGQEVHSALVVVDDGDSALNSGEPDPPRKIENAET